MRTMLSKIFAFLLATFFVVSVAYAASSNLSGYGWAGQKDAAGNTVGIGWVDFTGVTMGDSASSGILSGKAWSPNIGWVTFNSAELAGCPTAPCKAAADWVNLNSDNTVNVKGWARACSVYAAGCSGGLAENTARGDWDGWIALSNPSGANWTGTNSVRFSPTTGDFSGFAWGDQVVGWLDFTGVKANLAIPVCMDGSLAPNGDTAQCDMCPNDSGLQSNTNQCDVCPNDAGIQTSINQCNDTTPTTKYCANGEPAPSNDLTNCSQSTVICSDGTSAPNNDSAQCPTTPPGVPYCTNLPRYTQANPPKEVIVKDGKCSCPIGRVMKLVGGVYNCASSYYEEH